MIALPHLIFICTIGLAAWIAWPFLTDRDDFPLMTGQAVMLGLLTGGVLTVVIP